jgi:hypothetical protein
MYWVCFNIIPFFRKKYASWKKKTSPTGKGYYPETTACTLAARTNLSDLFFAAIMERQNNISKSKLLPLDKISRNYSHFQICHTYLCR